MKALDYFRDLGEGIKERLSISAVLAFGLGAALPFIKPEPLRKAIGWGTVFLLLVLWSFSPVSAAIGWVNILHFFLIGFALVNVFLGLRGLVDKK